MTMDAIEWAGAAPKLLLFLAAGAGVGFAYFLMLKRSATLLVADAPAWTQIALFAGRLLLVVALLGFAAGQGALPLIAAAFGLLVGRQVVISSAASRP